MVAIAHTRCALTLAASFTLSSAACGDDVAGAVLPAETTGAGTTADETSGSGGGSTGAPGPSTGGGESEGSDAGSTGTGAPQGSTGAGGGSSSSSSSSASSSSGSSARCGDGVVEGDEACEPGAGLREACPVFGEAACAEDCTLDLSQCVDTLVVCSTPMAGLSGTSQASPLTDPILVEDDFFVADVDVTVDITHPWIGDLTAVLVTPDAQAQSVLFDGPCGFAADIDARFDDDGFSPECTAPPALSGDVTPLTELNDLVGLGAMGAWSLMVWDAFPDSGDGTLQQWCVELTLAADDPVSCGDVVAHYGEACDGTDLGGADCASLGLGFTGGVLGCLGDCTGFDTSGCVTEVCGDGVAEGSEPCDGADLGEVAGCDDIPGFSGAGGVTCTEGCTFDTSACTSDVITVCSTPGAPISHEGPPTVDAVNVASAQTVADVDVFVDITHSWTSDLDIALASPGGTSVVLIEDPCVGIEFDDLSATFSDEGDPAPPEGECSETPPAVAGTIVPGGALSDFDGQSAAGDWVLTVVDDDDGDDGTLVEWCVMITVD